MRSQSRGDQDATLDLGFVNQHHRVNRASCIVGAVNETLYRAGEEIDDIGRQNGKSQKPCGCEQVRRWGEVLDQQVYA